MSKFIIQGGKPLSGEIDVLGSKNAALPIIIAALLTDETCIIENVPQITDIEKLILIISDLGVDVKRSGHTLEINAKNLNKSTPNAKLACQMRASVLLMSSLLARLGKAEIACPGGCIIGERPLDIHIKAFEDLGAKVDFDGEVYKVKVDKLNNSIIKMRKVSVTATENILIAAAKISGKTEIFNAAEEPHVVDLAEFLKKMGAKVEGEGTRNITVWGSEKLKGVKHKIIPDMLEAGTFAIAGAATGGNLKINNIEVTHLKSFLEKLDEVGVKFEVGDDYLKIMPSENFNPVVLKTDTYPGFATDFQSPFSVLLTKANGVSKIVETIFEKRLDYLKELAKMGAKIKILNNREAEIYGPTQLRGEKIKSLDLRAGATMILAALTAEGQSEIGQAEIIDRGYERIEERLVKIGAKIKRIN